MMLSDVSCEETVLRAVSILAIKESDLGRRYSRRGEQPEGLDGLFLAAHHSTPAGMLLTLFCVIAGAMLAANGKSLGGMAWLFTALMVVLAIVFGGLTLAGIVARRLEQLRTKSDSGPVAPRWARRTQRMQHSGTDAWCVQDAPSRASARPNQARAASSILSRGESAFYLPLRDVVAGRFDIHIKPSLADVLQCRNDPRYRNIGLMHVDFLLCDRQTQTPRLAIELDDRSHRQRGRTGLDRWKNELLAERGIPLLRQTAQQAYDVQALGEQIDRMISR